ncbi:MAG: nucleotidyltransferase domain-containing protein [Lactobacillales bacterium]|nr:nucleotidyltransferase domain-containing protein [Lactobacillales bacterium]
MIYTIESIKLKIKPVLDKYNVKTIYLFGSYSRGEADENSDIDLIFDRNGTTARGLAFFGFQEDLENALEKNVDVFPLDTLDLPSKRYNDPNFAKKVKKDEVLLFG